MGVTDSSSQSQAERLLDSENDLVAVGVTTFVPDTATDALAVRLPESDGAGENDADGDADRVTEFDVDQLPDKDVSRE